MAKYRLLNKNRYSNSRFEWGLIYDESYMGQRYPVKTLVANYPRDWELIKEEPMCTEKTIKLSLEQARKMYGKSPEMDELLLANFSKDELTKKALPKSWSEFAEKVTSGYYISDGVVNPVSNYRASTLCRRGRFATQKQARSALAMAQLSQLMAVYNDGWIADYSDANQIKIQIICAGNKIVSNWGCTQNEFLSFKTAELRDEFLKNFEPLIKEYFMID